MTGPSPPRPIPDGLQRLLFRGLSWGGARVQGWALGSLFDVLHRKPDRWDYTTDPYERERFATVLRAIGPGPFPRVLEVGCSQGIFTKTLASDSRVGAVTALDVSECALEAARARCEGFPNVTFVRGHSGFVAGPGPFDLIVCAELLYYLGGARERFAEAFAAQIAPGGSLVMEHPYPESERLHEPFVRHPRFTVRHREVTDHAVRPFEVVVLCTLP